MTQIRLRDAAARLLQYFFLYRSMRVFDFSVVWQLHNYIDAWRQLHSWSRMSV